MERSEGTASLQRAVNLLEQLEEDRETAPPEFRLVTESYATRLLESILRFRDRRIAGRELEAHRVQIRLCYTRDLQRLLPSEPVAPDPWVRTG